MAFCTSCGEQNKDGAKFCSSCGETIAQTRPAAQFAVPPPQPPYQQPLQPPPQPQQPQSSQYQQPQQPQSPQYQQPQPQYQPAAPSAAVKKHKLRVILPIVGVALVGIALLVIFVILPSVLNAMAERDFYNIANNDVPTVKYILGEKRNVTGVSTSTSSDGTQEQVVTYKTKSGEDPRQDMIAYATALCNEYGFYAINDNDFSGVTGKGFQFAKTSAIAGNLIVVQLDYDLSGYTVTLLHGKGAIDIPKEQLTGGGSASAPEPPDESDIADTQTPDLFERDIPTESGADSPDVSSGGDPANSLTAGIFNKVNGGTYHMLMLGLTGDTAGVEIDTYSKNGMTAMLMEAEGMRIRIIARDGKSYTVLDDLAMAYVADLSEYDGAPGFGDTQNLTYVGEGSGDFNGRSYRYDEYVSNDGQQLYYYMDGGSLKGIRAVTDGIIADIVILVFDDNVLDSVFEIPENYVVQDSSAMYGMDG